MHAKAPHSVTSHRQPKADASKSPSARPGLEVGRPDIGPQRAKHLRLDDRIVDTPTGAQRMTVDDAESPLGWLARRRGRDGRALIAPHQFLAGERLRADFTCAQMMPRTTADWSGIASSGRRAPSMSGGFSESATAARQRVNAALEAVGPEFSGLLLDLCCFLKGLEDIERMRGWPARSAKVVLQLALDRLARHYGYMAEARGHHAQAVRTWLADGAAFHVE